jgi:probable phosphoglycerate mutase
VKLALVRAGPAELGGRVAGALSVPLSVEGRDRARKAAQAIGKLGPTAALYRPAEGHAAEAGEEIARALATSSRVAEGLEELDLGLWQGLDEAEIAQRHRRAFEAFQTDARAVVPPEAEEVTAAHARLGKALEAIRRAHRREARTVVVVAGELAFALLEAAALGKEAPPDLWRLRLVGDDVRILSRD